MTKLSFLGAAETVTGSCFLVETDRNKFLVDCGMFQGPDVEDRNFEKFKFDPRQIDFLLLTHTHIDHSGLIPKLFREGFRGEVYMTVPTSHLAELLLLDAAKIQENNQRDEFRRRVLRMKKSQMSGNLLYDTRDALSAINSFRTVELDKEIEIREGIKATFINAGHILGAASIVVEVDNLRILFSGDIGHRGQELVAHFDLNKSLSVDYVVMESLYGGKYHEDRRLTERELIDAINLTLQRNGNVMIPSFAVERTQELLYIIKTAKQKRLIGDNVQVFLDSPLAIGATQIYTDSKLALSKMVQQSFALGDSPFSFPGLKTIRSYKQSLGIWKKEPSVIIAGSGMANGGRILSHFKKGLSDAKNSVCFVGYQAEQTLGRELTEGAKKVLIDDKVTRVKAKINTFFGFSAHGDNGDLLDFVGRLDKDRLRKVFLLHAELERSEVFKEELAKKQIEGVIPEWKQSIEL
ncbi:MBL fold metallo-hydrolase [Candidatus Dojkabacteria bacterium]|nr:MBL fold metallo-hydrolase [Candidatus Dojkabacteria bacterium]